MVTSGHSQRLVANFVCPFLTSRLIGGLAVGISWIIYYPRCHPLPERRKVDSSSGIRRGGREGRGLGPRSFYIGTVKGVAMNLESCVLQCHECMIILWFYKYDLCLVAMATVFGCHGNSNWLPQRLSEVAFREELLELTAVVRRELSFPPTHPKEHD